MDVYSDWIDACDSVAKDAAGSNNRDGPSTSRGLGPSGSAGGVDGGGQEDDEEEVAVAYDDDF